MLPVTVDTTRPDHLLALRHPDVRTLVDEDIATRPLPESYPSKIAQFERWVVFHDFAAEGKVWDLPETDLRVAIELWLGWCVTEVPQDHPLLRANRTDNQKGWRGTHLPVQVGIHRAAVRMAGHRAGKDVVSERAEAINYHSGRTTKARALTDDEITAVVKALVDEAVWPDLAESQRQLIHARELAAFTTQLAVSHRTGERHMFREENVTSSREGDEGLCELTVRLTRTKRHPQGRRVTLRRRDDDACPIGALVRFWRLCREHGIDRGGDLMPTIHTTHFDKAPSAPTYKNDSRRFSRIMEHIGVNEAAEVAAGLEKASPHGLRAVNITRAGESDVLTHAEQLELGGWLSEETASVYRRGGSNRNLTDSLAEKVSGARN